MKRLTLIALLSICRVSLVFACTDDQENNISYTMWGYAACANKKAPSPNLAYEVRRTGAHSAEVHFKNFSKDAVMIDFWLSGFQCAGDNPTATIVPSAPNDTETIVPVKLKSGGGGVNFALLQVYNLRGVGQTSPVETVTAEKIDDWGSDGWFVVYTSQPFPRFGSENISYRICRENGAAKVIFRNTGRNCAFFDFVIPGYQATVKNPRVTIAAGVACSIPVVLEKQDDLLPLARLRVFNIHVDADCGMYVDAAELDNGWFAVQAVNCSTINPNQIVYRVESLGQDKVKVHFKNISRSPVSFKYGFSGRPIDQSVSIAADAQTTVDAKLAGGPLQTALAKIRVTEVVYKPFMAAVEPTKTASVSR